MKAIWYEGFGPAGEVLVHGDMAMPEPGEGEVLVRLHASGVRLRNAEGWSDDEFRLMGELVIAQLRLRIHMRNAEFSFPLTQARIQAIFDGDIEPEKFDFERAEEVLA